MGERSLGRADWAVGSSLFEPLHGSFTYFAINHMCRTTSRYDENMLMAYEKLLWSFGHAMDAYRSLYQQLI